MILPTLLATALASAALAPHPCRAPLPRGPAVPAAIIVRTGCGGFELGPSGRVRRLSRRWLALHAGGTGRRYGAEISIRRTHRGRFVLLLHGDVIWQSSGGYYRTGDDAVFGPHLFAFNAYGRGVFLTDLRGPERLVLRGRALYPIDFTSAGELLVQVPGGSVAVVAPDGTLLRRYLFRRRNGFAYDEHTGTLYFVRRDGMLAAARGTSLRLLGRLHGIDGTIGFTPPGLLVFYGARSVAVTRLDGELVAEARWPHSRVDNFDSGLSVSPDGRSFAFRLSSTRPGASGGEAVVYVLRAGASQARVIYRHRLGPSACAVGAGMTWAGRFLLYSSADGRRAVLDTRSGHGIDLTGLLRRIPRRARTEQADVYWRRDLAHG